MQVKGDRPDGAGGFQTEILELWHRDPVECVRELLGNPAFRDSQHFVPEQHFRNRDGTNRQYDEMWTADWWWEIQVRLNMMLKGKANGLTLIHVEITS